MAKIPLSLRVKEAGESIRYFLSENGKAVGLLVPLALMIIAGLIYISR